MLTTGTFKSISIVTAIIVGLVCVLPAVIVASGVALWSVLTSSVPVPSGFLAGLALAGVTGAALIPFGSVLVIRRGTVFARCFACLIDLLVMVLLGKALWGTILVLVPLLVGVHLVAIMVYSKPPLRTSRQDGPAPVAPPTQAPYGRSKDMGPVTQPELRRYTEKPSGEDA